MAKEKLYPVRFRRNGVGGVGFYEVFIGGKDGLRAIAFVEEHLETGALIDTGRIAIVGTDPNLAWRYEAFASDIMASIRAATDESAFDYVTPVKVPAR